MEGRNIKQDNITLLPAAALNTADVAAGCRCGYSSFLGVLFRLTTFRRGQLGGGAVAGRPSVRRATCCRRAACCCSARNRWPTVIRVGGNSSSSGTFSHLPLGRTLAAATEQCAEPLLKPQHGLLELVLVSANRFPPCQTTAAC